MLIAAADAVPAKRIRVGDVSAIGEGSSQRKKERVGTKLKLLRNVLRNDVFSQTLHTNDMIKIFVTIYALHG